MTLIEQCQQFDQRYHRKMTIFISLAIILYV